MPLRIQTAIVVFLILVFVSSACNPNPQPEAPTAIPTLAQTGEEELAPALQTPPEGEAESPAATEAAAPEEAKGDAANGEAVYGIHCIACHAADGTAGIVGPTLVSAELAAQPDKYFRDVLVNGRIGTAMPAWGPILGDQDIEDLIAYIRSKQ